MNVQLRSIKNVFNKKLRDQSGTIPVLEIMMISMVFLFLILVAESEKAQKQKEAYRLSVRPEVVYENRWEKVKPLSTSKYAVDIEPSQVDGEKYAVYRFSEDNDGTQYRYALQENYDGTINTIRAEKLEPPRDKSGGMVVVPIFIPR